MNSPEDGPVGPKHVEIRQYTNKIEIVTSVGFYSIRSNIAFSSITEDWNTSRVRREHNGKLLETILQRVPTVNKLRSPVNTLKYCP